MIGLILGIVILCAVVYAILSLLPVPANIQRVIWIVVSLAILLWVASYFGYVPAHFGHEGHIS